MSWEVNLKIKSDFISNSSSTSFIYIARKDFTKEAFYEMIGVSPESPLSHMFEKLYNVLSNGIQGGEHLNESRLKDLTNDFTNDVIQKAKQALLDGEQVVKGSLDSETDGPESFLCMDVFEIKSQDLYINGFDNYW